MRIDIDNINIGIVIHDFFCELAAEFWPLIVVDWDVYAHLVFRLVWKALLWGYADSLTFLVITHNF